MSKDGLGFEERPLAPDEVRAVFAANLDKTVIKGKRVICIIPDSTRTCPLPFLFRAMCEAAGSAAQLDFLIALGTHQPMSEQAINRLLGLTPEERKGKYGRFRVFNHCWDDPNELKQIGTISADEIESISHGLLREDVPVKCNRRIFDYDQIVIIGPTFPHEVVGFSGGNKYFFPGISGPEVLNFFHWLGAVITLPLIIGQKRTPVRQVVDRAAAMITMPKLCFSLVVHHGELRGLFAGTPEAAYARAAELSDKLHVTYVEKPFKRVLSCAPPMYDEIWTAGKCMYKLEPALADGAELIIYAPHIDEVSYTHGRVIEEVGYHVRDYFRSRMEQFRQYPRGVLAHSTHVKGIGTFVDGIETPRVNVILATHIPRERCEKINLGYMDPDSIRPEEWDGRESEGIVRIPKAGETLYRLADGSVPRIPGDPVYAF
jgi:nickel-dependent lactate racemase